MVGGEKKGFHKLFCLNVLGGARRMIWKLPDNLALKLLYRIRREKGRVLCMADEKTSGLMPEANA